MIIKLHPGVQDGDFIRRHGHNRRAQDKWWKVLSHDGDALNVVDRHGYHQTFVWTQNRKYKVWEPGDRRDDGEI